MCGKGHWTSDDPISNSRWSWASHSLCIPVSWVIAQGENICLVELRGKWFNIGKSWHSIGGALLMSSQPFWLWVSKLWSSLLWRGDPLWYNSQPHTNHLLGKLFAPGSGMKAQVAEGSQWVLFVWAGILALEELFSCLEFSDCKPAGICWAPVLLGVLGYHCVFKEFSMNTKREIVHLKYITKKEINHILP